MIVNKLELEATNILRFMASNKLIANEAKTELMLIRPRRKPLENPVVIQVGSAVRQ